MFSESYLFLTNQRLSCSEMALDMRRLYAEILAEDQGRSVRPDSSIPTASSSFTPAEVRECPLNNDGFAVSLEEHRLEKGPAASFLIENFLSVAEEEQLVAYIQSFEAFQWVQLKRRRLIQFEERQGEHLRQLPITATLQSIIDRCSQAGVQFIQSESETGSSRANHILINEYKPGEGICSHQDGPAFVPTVAVLSLCSSLVLRFVPSVARDAPTAFAVLLPPRSLFVFSADLYTRFWHCIDEVETDNLSEFPSHRLALPKHAELPADDSLLQRQYRLSLTIRRTCF